MQYIINNNNKNNGKDKNTKIIQNIILSQFNDKRYMISSSCPGRVGTDRYILSLCLWQCVGSNCIVEKKLPKDVRIYLFFINLYTHPTPRTWKIYYIPLAVRTLIKNSHLRPYNLPNVYYVLLANVLSDIKCYSKS